MNGVDILHKNVNSVNIRAMSTIPTTRYHHGDLAEALIRAGHAACQTAGPSGLVIRDLAATCGVSPAAAYRHFSSIDHLRAAVSQRAREDLARHMLQACEQASGGRTAAERARQRFHAIGEGYVRFALAEPQLFATAFTACSAFPTRPDAPSAWQVLVDAIDMLITTGVMPESRRDEAPWIAWSSVHGLSSILLNQTMPEPADVNRMIERVLQGVKRAIS